MAYLEEQDVAIEVVDYVNHPPSLETLDALIAMLDVEPQALVRFKDALAKELGLSATDQRTRTEWLTLLTEHSRLMERPIVQVGDQAAIGRPLENVQQLFEA